jgi:hypothetical protein
MAYFGDVVYFSLINGKLIAQFAAGVTSESFASPYLIGEVYADIDYSGNKFKLVNFRFKPEEELLLK